MSLNNPRPGLGFVPEYQVSSWPFVTSSNLATAGTIHRHDFPGVTRWISIHNNESSGASKTLCVSFSLNGFKPGVSNFYQLHAGEQTSRWEFKCTSLFLSASHDNVAYSLAAGYTSIDTDQFPILSSSNGFLGVG